MFSLSQTHSCSRSQSLGLSALAHSPSLTDSQLVGANLLAVSFLSRCSVLSRSVMVLSRRYPLALALPAEVQSRRPSSRRSTPLSNPRRLTLSLRVPPLHSSVESTPLLIVHNSRRRRTRRNQLSPKIQDGRVW